MRRLLRWSFHLAAAVSAVLFVAVCVLWVRSGRILDSVDWGDGYFFSSLRGFVAIGRQQPAASWPDGGRIRWETFPAAQAWPNWPGLVFKVAEPSAWNGIRTSILQVPHWLYLLLFLAVPLLWLARLWRRLRRRASQPGEVLCPMCGYDLRATPHRCPECGAEGTVAERE